MSMLGKALLRNTQEIVTLINKLMALVVGGFTHELADVQIAAFSAWFVIHDVLVSTVSLLGPFLQVGVHRCECLIAASTDETSTFRVNHQAATATFAKGTFLLFDLNSFHTSFQTPAVVLCKRIETLWHLMVSLGSHANEKLSQVGSMLTRILNSLVPQFHFCEATTFNRRCCFR